MQRKSKYLALTCGICAILIVLVLIFIVPSISASSSHMQKAPVAQTAATPILTSTPKSKAAIVIIKPKPTSIMVVPSATPVSSISAATPTVASSQSNTVTSVQGQRVVTFVNKTQQMIWVAASSNPGHSLATTGWLLPAGASASTIIPDAWNGRIWGRTGCNFDSAGNNGHCETGDCGGHFQCGLSWGALPSTLAEFNFNSYAGLDFYDVSLVDGSNLPMWINSYGGDKPDVINADGCSVAGCTHDVNATCPAILQIKNASGQLIACTSACNAIGGNQYCCRGPEACDPTTWPINYAKIFKTAEPFAYSYSSDDATSTLTCKPECNYRITFGVS